MAEEKDRQRRATDRLGLLARAGALFAESLDVGVTLEAVARISVEWFAQIAVVRIVEGGKLSRDAVAGSNPAIEAAVRRELGRYGSPRLQIDLARAPPSLREAVVSRRATLIRDIDDEVLRGFALDDPQVESFRSMGLSSIIVVPLIARGRTIGLMTLSQLHGKTFDSDDLALADALGIRAALAVDNARLFERLNTAVAVRDEFLAIASHELNTPLTALKIQLDSLRLGKVPAERRGERIEAASRQVTRLARLVSDLLDVSRMAAGGVRIEKTPFDLSLLLDEVVSRLADETRRSGSAILVRAERPCLGSWDRPKIDQVITNLLCNAVKYGGGRDIDVELKSAGISVQLSVCDKGIGIDPVHQDRIFERFERATSARNYGGFGLGLWIAKQIVESSGGTITVESSLTQGATFIVGLPRE